MRSADRERGCRRSLALAIVLLAAGCTAAVRVHRADSRSVHRELTRNVLTTGELSEPTHNVLHRYGLGEVFRKRPDDVLATLHAAVAGATDGPDASDDIFAL